MEVLQKKIEEKYASADVKVYGGLLDVYVCWSDCPHGFMYNVFNNLGAVTMCAWGFETPEDALNGALNALEKEENEFKKKYVMNFK